MPRRGASTKYRVLNPRNVPEDVPVVTLEEKSKGGVILQTIRLYAGQQFAPPDSVNVRHLVAGGFIEKV